MTDSCQQILPCIICNTHHQQMLMLSCMHDPCINCAAKHYFSSKSSHTQIYICEKCGEITQLDSSTIISLQDVYMHLQENKQYQNPRIIHPIIETDKYEKPIISNPRNFRKQYTGHHQILNPKNRSSEQPLTQNPQSTYQPINHTYTPISQPSHLSNPYKTTTNIRKHQQLFTMCKSHPQQQLSYFCFACTIPICPQCAIHGLHRQHQVQSTRKSIKIIKTNLQKSLQSLNKQISTIVNIVDTYKNKIKQHHLQINKQKDYIKHQFHQLKNIINAKQTSFLNLLDNHHLSNTNTIKNQTNNLEHVIDEHSSIKKQIQTTLKKDDLSILQQFSKRQKQAKSIIQSNKYNKYNTNIDGLQYVDYDVFKDQTGQYSGIISALRLNVQPKKKNNMDHF